MGKLYESGYFSNGCDDKMIETYYIASILKHKMNITSLIQLGCPLEFVSTSKIASFIENKKDLNSLWPKCVLFDLNAFYQNVIEMRKKNLDEWKNVFVTLPYTDKYMILLGKFLETHTESENFYMKKEIANHLNKGNDTTFYDAIFREYIHEKNQEDSCSKSI